MIFEKSRRRWQTLRTLGSRLNEIDDQLLANKSETDRLRAELEAFKSRLEVGPELIADFLNWKAAHPIPERPLVSVCVATYNRAELLTERCIRSVLSQTYSDLELIVVGDGCSDDTGKRVSDITDQRLTFFNLPSRGEYPSDKTHRWMVAGTNAVNKAMSLARGDYITHLDDDDEYVPERLEKLVDFAVTNECDFVWHPFWAERPNGEWALNEARELAYGKVTTSSVFYRQWFRKIEWDINAYLLREPGDWNRFRRIKYIAPVARRYPEPLVRHYREREQHR